MGLFKVKINCILRRNCKKSKHFYAMFIWKKLFSSFYRVVPKPKPIRISSIVRIRNFDVWTNSIAFTKRGSVTEIPIAQMVQMNPSRSAARVKNAARINLRATTELVFRAIYNVPVIRNVPTDPTKKCAVSWKLFCS